MATRVHSTPAPRIPPSAKPDPLRVRMERALEKMMAAAERLLVELDALDGDADLEPEPDEPSLGALECTGCYAGIDQRSWGLTGTHDREGAEDDREPTLGSLEQPIDQIGWGGRADAVGEDEPSLGSLDNLDQTSWGDHESGSDLFARGRDIEAQCEDEGADADREPDADQEPAFAAPYVADQREWANLLQGA